MLAACQIYIGFISILAYLPVKWLGQVCRPSMLSCWVCLVCQVCRVCRPSLWPTRFFNLSCLSGLSVCLPFWSTCRYPEKGKMSLEGKQILSFFRCLLKKKLMLSHVVCATLPHCGTILICCVVRAKYCVGTASLYRTHVLHDDRCTLHG